MTTEQTGNPKILPNNDSSSVYYIHPSDYTPQQLVSTKFNGNGFANWKKCILMAFSAKNKLGFIHGTLEKPTSEPESSAWNRCNDLIMSWIIFNLDPKIAESVMSFNSASEIWKDLEEKFAYASHTKIYNLEKQLGEINQGMLTILEFYTKFKALWDDLNTIDPIPTCVCQQCTCNLAGRLAKQQENRKIIRFMMKLKDQYSGIRSNVLMMKVLPHLSEAFRLFSQEEDHKEIAQQTPAIEPLALAAPPALALAAPPGRFYQPGFRPQINRPHVIPNNNNIKNQNTNNGRRAASSYYCTHCKVPGHSYERCFKIHGYPPGFKGFKDKRVAASVHSVESTTSDTASTASSISVDQYNYLIEVLNKRPPTPSMSENNSTPSADPEITYQANLAGALLDRASNSSW